MRSLGEEPYRYWVVERLRETPVPLYLFCIFGAEFAVASIGLALMYFSQYHLVPFAGRSGHRNLCGGVTFFTLLSLWRIRRVSA